eukprot:SM000001S04478  [mRNA]  locus=s1:467581:468051:- [translate_table: standard]
MAAAREEAELDARLAVVLAPPLAAAWGFDDDDDDGGSGDGAAKAAAGMAGSGQDDPMELLPESPGEREHCHGDDDLLGDWASFLPPLPPDECFAGAS